ncbi:hypothetical protein BN946_scf184665.g15 [Trametes cinnabarina]|uniref:NAD(P)-binding protein n=1 Tax=Pycnoporus cinnabarinus TaxID=5643 RepID=A0A060SU80_PYCCI|nr:hypothetical protein BN946_scf184665.g15 [Trametes cinnabarina]
MDGLHPTLDSFIRERWEARYLTNWDANDMLALLDTWQRGDISSIRHGNDLVSCLKSIKAKALIMPCKTDLYFCPEDSMNEVSILENAELAVIDSVWGHVGMCFSFGSSWQLISWYSGRRMRTQVGGIPTANEKNCVQNREKPPYILTRIVIISFELCVQAGKTTSRLTFNSSPYFVFYLMPHIYASLLPPPKATWGVADIPDLSEKVMIVTGGNSGIGRETIKALLQHNAKVYMASRNELKASEAIEELLHETGRRAHFLRLDLADLRSIKAAAQEFISKETELHVIFNNAGVTFPPVEELTLDGYDLQFGTNVLGHFYLTQLLIPVLLSGASHSQDGRARVINTSVAHAAVSNIDFDTLKDHVKRRKVGTQRLHYQSKFVRGPSGTIRNSRDAADH